MSQLQEQVQGLQVQLNASQQVSKALTCAIAPKHNVVQAPKHKANVGLPPLNTAISSAAGMRQPCLQTPCAWERTLD